MIDTIDTIYCDFDGTITKKDAVNGFLENHADKAWLDIEQHWIDGEISSRECMSTQVEMCKGTSQADFDKYIDSIEIDEGFKEFCGLMESMGKNIVVVSDGFDVFIRELLNRNGLAHIPYFSNKLEIKGDEELEFNLSFPYSKEGCPSGVCKCDCVSSDKPFAYVGDGLSDRCIAKSATLLFAKKTLKKHCIQNEIDYVDFDTFKDIVKYIQKGDKLCKV